MISSNIIFLIYRKLSINDATSMARCNHQFNKLFLQSLKYVLRNNNYIDVEKVFKHTNMETVKFMLKSETFDKSLVITFAGSLKYFTKQQNLEIIKKIICNFDNTFYKDINLSYIKLDIDIIRIIGYNKRIFTRACEEKNWPIIDYIFGRKKYFDIANLLGIDLLDKYPEASKQELFNNACAFGKMDTIKQMHDANLQEAAIYVSTREVMQEFLNRGLHPNFLLFAKCADKCLDLLTQSDDYVKLYLLSRDKKYLQLIECPLSRRSLTLVHYIEKLEFEQLCNDFIILDDIKISIKRVLEIAFLNKKKNIVKTILDNFKINIDDMVTEWNGIYNVKMYKFLYKNNYITIDYLLQHVIRHNLVYLINYCKSSTRGLEFAKKFNRHYLIKYYEKK